MPTMIDRLIRIFVCCCAIGHFAHSPAAALADPNPGSNEAEHVLLGALDERVTVDFNDEPVLRALDSLIDVLPKEERFSLAIDRRSLAEGGVNLEGKVTLRAANIRLSSALNFLLGQVDAAWTVKDEMLLVTTRSVADHEMVVLAYNLRDFPFRGTDADAAPDFQRLIDVIRSEIAPDSWDNCGGPGSVALFGQNGYSHNDYHLIVRHSLAVHIEIKRLVNELRSHSPLSAAEKKILKGLDEPTVLEFVETPLSDVIAYLRDLHQIEIRMDAETFDGCQPVTKTLRGVNLKRALVTVLDPFDLTYVIKDEGLLITTKKNAEKMNAEARRAFDRSLAAPAPLAPDEAAPASASKVADENDLAAKRIRKALDEPTVLQFVETSLTDVVEYLKDRHKIEIQTTLKALENAGDRGITANVSGGALKRALRIVLDPLDLTYVVKDGVLLIIGKAEALNPGAADASPILCPLSPIGPPRTPGEAPPPPAKKTNETKAPAGDKQTPLAEDPVVK